MCVCVLQPVYRKLLPLYFPRSEEEEQACRPLIPADIGNSEGEPIVPERQIRISEKPGVLEGERPTSPCPLSHVHLTRARQRLIPDVCLNGLISQNPLEQGSGPGLRAPGVGGSLRQSLSRT